MQPPDHIYEPRQLEVFASHQGLSHVEIKRFKNLLFKKSASSDEALALWPQPVAALLREKTTFEVLSLHEAHASADGSAEKLIFKMCCKITTLVNTSNLKVFLIIFFNVYRRK